MSLLERAQDQRGQRRAPPPGAPHVLLDQMRDLPHQLRRLLPRHVLGQRRRGKRRQIVLPQRNREVAALCDGDAVGESVGQVRKRFRHLGLRQEILRRGEALRAPRIGEDIAFGDADSRLVRTKLVARGELHRMRRDHGQRELGTEPHHCCGQCVILGVTGALHFQVETLREERRPS